MFNLQGSEIIFTLLLALVVLGPEKLPGAIKRVMTTYAELRKLGSGFQDEFKSAIDQPMREMRETADLLKDQVDPKKIAEDAERAAEAAAAADRDDAALVAAGSAASATTDSDADAESADGDDDVDPFEDPVDEFDDPVEVSDDPVEVSDGSTDESADEDSRDEPLEESA